MRIRGSWGRRRSASESPRWRELEGVSELREAIAMALHITRRTYIASVFGQVHNQTVIQRKTSRSL